MIEQLYKIADVWWSWMWPMSWQVSVLVVFIGAADLFLRKRAWPQARYALWLLIMVKLILPPTFSLSTSIVSQLRPWAEQSIMRQTTRGEFPAVANLNEDLKVAKPLFDTQNLASAPVAEAAPATGAGANGNFSTAAVGAARPSWQVYVMLVWLLGVVTLAAWLIMRFRQLRAVHYGNVDNADLPDWLEQLLSETAKKLNLKRLPAVALSQSIACPDVFGMFRPVLLLPKQNITQISRKDTEHILLHELAHIKRGDLCVHGIYMVLQIVYWFNPLLWLVRRKLQHLRELCCDATVAAILREKTEDYRETILQTAKWLLDKPKMSGIGILGLVERPSRLLARLNWLEKKTWRYPKMKKVTVITVSVLMITFVLPMAKAQKPEKIEAAFNIEREQKSAASLHQAAASDDVEQVKSLISKGADINAKDDDGWSPLHHAAKQGHRDVVRLLIANGADVNAENAENGEYETPLYFAAKHGHKDVAELLIAKGADVNARDMWGETVLEVACWTKHGDVAELLVAKGADVNAKDMWGWTPLYYAIWYKPDRDTAKLLIDNGADVNFVRQGNSYLHYTVRKDNIELTKLLVNNGAKLDVKDYRGYTPFSYAVAQGNREIIELFVSKGVDVSTFHKAACVGDLNRVKLFVQRGADVNEKDELGWTPLLFAASLGRTEVAEFLIDNGADIHAKMYDGRTALHQALQVGAAKLAELLIAKGADVNAKTAKDHTPLHEAVRAEHGRKLEVIAVIEVLIAKGADVNAKNNDGCTPMHLTAMKGHTNVAKLLLAKGANVNAMNEYGYTPLDFALWPGYSKEFVECLRKHGAKE